MELVMTAGADGVGSDMKGLDGKKRTPADGLSRNGIRCNLYRRAGGVALEVGVVGDEVVEGGTEMGAVVGTVNGGIQVGGAEAVAEGEAPGVIVDEPVGGGHVLVLRHGDEFRQARPAEHGR